VLLLIRLFLFYNFTKFYTGFAFFQRYIIKTENVFSIIREINEILSLTNEPDKLVNTALDTISQIMGIEGCWIQTIDDRKNQKLSLAADRGFTDEMKSEIAAMGLKHDFTGQIIGMGNKVTIPDLNNDGAYGLGSFRKAGYKWVVAVPLMTYRAWGLLGTASKNKKLLDKDTAELVMVIGGLIANAWSKAHLSERSPRRGNLPEIVEIKQDEVRVPVPAETATETTPITPSAEATAQEALVPPPDAPNDPLPEEPAPVTATNKPAAENNPLPEKHVAFTVVKPPPAENIPPLNIPKAADPAFHSHKRKMENFRKTHNQAK
jgi:hypothetical protein